MTVEFAVRSEADTERLGQLLARNLPVRCIVSLDGALGAGKTRLVRAFAVACGISAKEVTSPTFTLWQTYHGSRTIHHLDAYRIHDEDEFEALGVEEVLDSDSITFIEWASRIEKCLPKSGHLAIVIGVVSERERRVSFASADIVINELVGKLADQYR